jgi:hypothetical protein
LARCPGRRLAVAGVRILSHEIFPSGWAASQ